MLCVVALAAWVRISGFDRGWSSDELANVMLGGAWQIYADPEAGVNPPLLRMLFNAPFVDADTPRYGRWFSYGWSLVAVALAFVAGKDAARGSLVAATVAALMVALHPMAITYATIYRIYSWWMATTLWHIVAMGRWIDAEPGRGRVWAVQAVGTAMLLPWIHYFSVPLLLVEGLVILLAFPGKRRWILALVPAALSISPMIAVVLNQPARRVAPGEPILHTMTKIVGLGLTPPMLLANPAANLSKAVDLQPFHWPQWMAASLGLAVLLTVVLWTRISTTQRLLASGCVAVAGGTYVLGQVQWVRDPTMLFMLVCMAPLLASLPALLPGPRFTAVGTVFLVWWVGAGLPEKLAYEQERTAQRDAIPDFARSFDSYDVGGKRRVWVHKAYFVGSLYFELKGEHFGRGRRPPWCVRVPTCFEFERTRFAGVDQVGDGSTLEGLLVSFDDHRPEGFASACEPLQDQIAYGIWDCHRAPIELP